MRSESPKVIEVQDYDELWEAILAKTDEIRHASPNPGNYSREAASYSENGQWLSTVLDISLDDGTHLVYRIRVRKDARKRIETRVDRWFHNADDYWEAQIAKDREEPHRAVVIDGVHYRLGPNGDKYSPRNGFAGRSHEIAFLDGRNVVTRDLWHQGTIPPVFRDRLPDNATWGDAP